MHKYEYIYVNQAWTPPAHKHTIAVRNPATEEVVAAVPRGAAADVDRAVVAAQQALPAWSDTAPQTRQRYLRRLAHEMREDADTIAEIIVAELGSPISAARQVQTRTAADIIDSFAAELDSFEWEQQLGSSHVCREAVGVVGAICPWNYPLYQSACKIGAALAAGCTVVLKPSELTPLNAYALIDATERAQLPPGVVNMVTGLGPEVGEALVLHPGVDMVSFTGSTRAGRRVAELAAQGPKAATLELGGKSAAVVLDDADLESVVPRVVRNCFRNSGQVCSGHSRMLVPASRADEAAEIAAVVANALVTGDPRQPDTQLGPLVSATQRDRVLGYIDRGMSEGARLVAGGAEPPVECRRGYYVRPTVFTGVQSHMTIAREEIFGPVLCILAYRDEADAVRLANETAYGLSGGVWSADVERALRVARQLRTGEVELNGAPFNIRAPFGGIKQSGYGRELGPYGVTEFTTIKAIHR